MTIIGNKKQSSENKQACLIAIVYVFCCKVFKCSLMRFIPQYDIIFEMLSMCIGLFMLLYIVDQYKNKDLSHYVSALTISYYSSILVCFLIHGQNFLASFRELCHYTGPMMIMIFFLLKRRNVSLRVLMKAITIACTLYAIAYIVGTLTFPNQIFGYDSNELKQDEILASMETRGVLRLFIYGSQIIPLTIYMILTYFNKAKKFYILLIPLFILLIMQGARTPFFVCILVSVLFVVYRMKRRIIALMLAICIYIAGLTIYNSLMESTSHDALTTYVQMTQEQVENNEDEDDIRVEMAKFMLFDYNQSNLFRVIFGNGFPSGDSEYSLQLRKLSRNQHYYTDDVGIIQIFVYLGLVGLIVYFLVFYKGIKTTVPIEFSFGKLFLIHYILISFANNAMIRYGVFTLGLALYGIYRANLEMKLKSSIYDVPKK